MKDLYFHPWKPDPDSFDGTLVIADSHYRGRDGGRSGHGVGFDCLLSGDDRNWTIAQIKDCTKLQAEPDTPLLYQRLRDVIHPELTVAECFQRVGFANVFQQVLPEASADRPWTTVPQSFLASLAAVEPRLVLVCGKTIWNWLPPPDDKRFKCDIELRRYGACWVTWCYHPSGKFSRHLFDSVAVRGRFQMLSDVADRATGSRQ